MIGRAILTVSVASGLLIAARPPRGREPEVIIYNVSGCFGSCPVYTVTARSDGRGTFEGSRFTALLGTRNFRISEGKYQRLVADLAPLQPRRGSVDLTAERCHQVAFDLPSAQVTWVKGRVRQALTYNSACDHRRFPGYMARLSRVLDVLGIRQMVVPPESP